MTSQASFLFANLMGDLVLRAEGPSYLDNFSRWVFQLSVLPAPERNAFRKSLSEVAQDFQEAGQASLSTSLNRLSTLALG